MRSLARGINEGGHCRRNGGSARVLAQNRPETTAKRKAKDFMGPKAGENLGRQSSFVEYAEPLFQKRITRVARKRGARNAGLEEESGKLSEKISVC
jgi:hypothetical protein